MEISGKMIEPIILLPGKLWRRCAPTFDWERSKREGWRTPDWRSFFIDGAHTIKGGLISTDSGPRAKLFRSSGSNRDGGGRSVRGSGIPAIDSRQPHTQKKGRKKMHRLQNCKQPHEQDTERSNTWAKFKNLVTTKKTIAANLSWVEKDFHLT
jgi:hypothetical protein